METKFYYINGNDYNSENKSFYYINCLGVEQKNCYIKRIFVSKEVYDLVNFYDPFTDITERIKFGYSAKNSSFYLFFA